MKNCTLLLLLLCGGTAACANEIDDLSVVRPLKPKVWNTFSLAQVRLLPSGPFYAAMTVSQQYLLGMDIERMLNVNRRWAGLPQTTTVYPGSFQPEGTRPGDLPHYLSGIALMYGQTGDQRFLQRVNYIVAELKACLDRTEERIRAGDTTLRRRFQQGWQRILTGHIELAGPDESGYPWGGTTGNDWYGVHKVLAAYRDAYLYAGNGTALQLMIREAEPITRFVLKANPDLFDNMLDLEHGGMNEVFADLYALTGDPRFMAVSRKFNHQKVILNIAHGTDILYGRHANMQIPTFNGTARQYQLTGDEVSRKATENFLRMVYSSHTTAIGGNSRYERFGRPGETTKLLGFTANETCNTYNMLKVALNCFASTGDLQHMAYFERALYNHILASQDPGSGGVTYYTSLMPGSFKSFSKGYDLTGVWCCVGTGMENHSKYGEAIYFHNNKDLFVNLFIPSELDWKERGLRLTMETAFPEEDFITLKLRESSRFDDQIYVRYPTWVKRPARVWINGKPVSAPVQDGYIRLQKAWQEGDVIRLELPQDFRLEPAGDDPNTVAICRGPLVLAGELGAGRMPGSDLVRHAHFQYRGWAPPTDDIPLLVADKVNLAGWIQPAGGAGLAFRTQGAGLLNGRKKDVSLVPFYKMHHQRYTVYWKLYSRDEWAFRPEVVSDEVNTASQQDEKAHNFRGEKTDTASKKDVRDWWENNRPGRLARDGGWFTYDLKVNNKSSRHFLVVTYWGGTDRGHLFDLLVEEQLIRSEDLHDRWPLTFYEEVYELPEELVRGKQQVSVKFAARPGQNAGPVYALRLTSDPGLYPNYLFY